MVNIEELKSVAQNIIEGCKTTSFEDMAKFSKDSLDTLKSKYSTAEIMVITGIMAELMEESMSKRMNKNEKSNKKKENKAKACDKNCDECDLIDVEVLEQDDCILIKPSEKVTSEEWLKIIEDMKKDYLVGFRELVYRDNVIIVAYKGYKDLVLCFDEYADNIEEVYEYLQNEFAFFGEQVEYEDEDKDIIGVGVQERENVIFFKPDKEIDIEEWLFIIEGHKKDYSKGLVSMNKTDKMIVLTYEEGKDIALCFKVGKNNIEEICEQLEKEMNFRINNVK